MRSIICLLAFASSTSGFHNPIPDNRGSIAFRPSPLHVGNAIETETEARLLLLKARDCAYGDSCSIEDCEILLREMMHLQSGCVTGTLVGHDLCEEQDIAADVVAHLREQVKSRPGVVTKGTTSVVPMIATELSLGAMMLVVAIFWSTLEMDRNGTPLSMQEWWWAIRDGYLGDAVKQTIQDGGF